MSFVSHSYAIRMSLVCTRMSPVCHSYVLVCHLHVTRLWFYREPVINENNKMTRKLGLGSRCYIGHEGKTFSGGKSKSNAFELIKLL